jgi:hypothetical protein
MASGDFEDFRASRRCCRRQGRELAEGLEAELHAVRERLRGIRLLMDSPCAIGGACGARRRTSETARPCALSSTPTPTPLFLVDADAHDDEVDVRVAQARRLIGAGVEPQAKCGAMWVSLLAQPARGETGRPGCRRCGRVAPAARR